VTTTWGEDAEVTVKSGEGEGFRMRVKPLLVGRNQIKVVFSYARVVNNVDQAWVGHTHVGPVGKAFMYGSKNDVTGDKFRVQITPMEDYDISAFVAPREALDSARLLRLRKLEMED